MALKKGLYGVYKPLQPNQRQGDEIVTNYLDRQEKKRALDLQEKSMAPPRREVKYTAEVIEDVPYNFTKIAGTIQSEYERYAVQIQDSDMSFADQKASMARLESGADGLQSIFTSYAEMVKALEDPDVIDTLDGATADRLLDQTRTIVEGEFDVKMNPNTYKISIVDRNGDEWSLRDKGRELQGMRADISGAKSQYGKTQKLREGAGFYGKANAQWANGKQKQFNDPDVHSAYESAFEANWGPIISPEDEAKAERDGTKLYGKTRAEAEKIMQDQYTADFNMADPTPKPSPTEDAKPEKSIYDYRVSRGEMIDYSNTGQGGVYAVKLSEGAKGADPKVPFTDPRYGQPIDAVVNHLAYDGNGKVTGARVSVTPDDNLVKEYMEARNWTEKQAMEYLTKEVRFIAVNKKGLTNYLLNNPEEAFPSNINEARKIANGSGTNAEKEAQLYKLYIAKDNSEEELNKTYRNNRSTIYSRFKYTIDAMGKAHGGSNQGILD